MSDNESDVAEEEEMSEEKPTAELQEDDRGLAENDEEMMNMFASVWVKVEVKDDDDSRNCEQTPAVDTQTTQEIGDIIIETNNDQDKSNSTQIVRVSNPTNNAKKPRRKWRPSKELKCDLCEYTTTYKRCLEIHMTAHGSDKPHVCNQCNYSTKYPSSLMRHVLIKHAETNDLCPNRKRITKVKCDQCDYTTNFKWNLKSHKRKHKLEKQYKCPQCPFETAYRHNLLKHGKVHREDEVFKCDKCPFVTKFEGHIQRHLAKIHKEVTEIYQRYQCDVCDFSTKERWRLNIHKQRSKQESPMKCLYCDFETEYRCEKRKHKTCHYSEMYGNGRSPNSPKILEDINSIMYGNERTLSSKTVDMNMVKRAVDIVENRVEKQTELEKTYVPHEPIDKPDSNDKYTLDPDCVEWSTIQVLESNDLDRPFQCHMCDYTSKFKASVQRHFQRHHTGTKNRPFKCCNCDFSTKTKDQIALHNKRSQSEIILYCTVPNCRFSTYYKCKYGMHQKDHYVYKCTICNYSFKYKYGLSKHIATLHLGNTLKCNYCDYKASRKESILCHETIHTGIKPFKCGFCDYSSVRKSLLNTHMKRYHGEDAKDMTVISDSKINELKVNLFGQMNVPKVLDSSGMDGSSLSVPGLNRYHGDDEKKMTVISDSKINELKVNLFGHMDVPKVLDSPGMDGSSPSIPGLNRYHGDDEKNMTVISDSKINELKVNLFGQIGVPKVSGCSGMDEEENIDIEFLPGG